MKVILKEDIKGTGKKGDVVNVADGYARNSLIPKGIAMPATAGNLNILAGEQAHVKAVEQMKLDEAQGISDKLKNFTLEISAKTGVNGKLFGSVTNKDIADNLEKKHKIVIDKRLIKCEHIKETGIFTINVNLHSQVKAEIKVRIEGI